MIDSEQTSPYLLMIETSTMVGSVAIYKGSELLGYLEYRKPRAHAKLILPMIQHLMEDLELDPETLDAVAVSKGPGSYTGLRVGVATAKGLCMAANKPLIAIDSLTVIAFQVKKIAEQIHAWVCPMIDARRMEVYTTVFNTHLIMQEEIHSQILTETSFQELLNERKVIFAGDGVEKSTRLFEHHPNAILMSNVHTSAKNLGPFLLKQFAQRDFEDLVTFEPFYLKDFVATKPKKKW